MPMKSNSMDEMKQIFREMGQQIGAAIGESMVEAVRAQLPRLREELGSPMPSNPARTRVAVAARGAKVSMALTKPCPVPECGRPGRGPRFSFLCEVHREMPPEEREKYRVRPKGESRR